MEVKNEFATAQSNANRIKTEEIIKSGISLEKPIFADGDLGKFAKKILREDGFYDVVLHGTPEYVEFFSTKIDSKTLAKIIKGRKDYNGEAIRLISCSTGNTLDTANCFAQRLSNELRVTVKAPTHTVYVFDNGKMNVGKSNQGEFKVFYPRK